MRDNVAFPFACVGVISIICQAVGIFSPAWMTYSFRTNTDLGWHGDAFRNSSYSNISASRDKSSSETRTNSDDAGDTLTITTESNIASDKSTHSTGADKDGSQMPGNFSRTDKNDNTSKNSEKPDTGVRNKSLNSSITEEVGTEEVGNDKLNYSVTDIKTNGSSNNLTTNTETDVSLKIGLEVRMGLWSKSACIFWSEYVEECESAPTLNLEDKLSRIAYLTNTTASRHLVGNWASLRILTVSAFIFAGFGLILLFAFSRAVTKKAFWHGGMAAATWFLSGMLIFAAVGKQASYIHKYSSQLDVINYTDTGYLFQFYTPWAAVISGIGGAISVSIATGMTLYLFRRHRHRTLDQYLPFVSVHSLEATNTFTQNHIDTSL